MAVRSEVDDDVLQVGLGRVFGDGHGAAVGNVGRGDRLVAGHERTQGGLESVGADHDVGLVVHAGGGVGHAAAVDGFHALDHDVVDELDARRLTAFEQDPVQVAAVDHDVRCAVAFREFPAERLAGELLAGDGVAEDEVLGLDADLQRLFQQAPAPQDAGGVGGHLQARADLAEFGGPFHEGYLGAVFTQCEGSGQSGHSPSDDEDIGGRGVLRHCLLL